MPRDNHHRCDDCGVLLSKSYPYNYCPGHWRQRYGAPPGKFSPWYRPAAEKPHQDHLLFPCVISDHPGALDSSRAGT